jgi:nitrogen fixation NifU-like protein
MNELEDLYREIILDHYRSPRNRGELAVPPAHRVEGFNPLCGDEIVLFLDVRDGVLEDLKISGRGCSISQSSASMMSAAVKGLPVDEVRRLVRSFKSMMAIAGPPQTGAGAPGGAAGEAVDPATLGELGALQGVVKFPVRIKCATLAWNALTQGLDEIAAGVAGAPG